MLKSFNIQLFEKALDLNISKAFWQEEAKLNWERNQEGDIQIHKDTCSLTFDPNLKNFNN